MRTFDKKHGRSQAQVSTDLGRSSAARAVASRPSLSFLHLQSTIGNQAIQRLLRSNAEELSADSLGQQLQASQVVQPAQTNKLQGDAYEQEAEQAAQQVMGAAETPATIVPLTTTASVQRKAKAGSHGDAAEPSVHDALAAPAHPLEPDTRSFMETRFGQDFSPVGITARREADPLMQGLNARAFTHGERIVFASGEYAPHTTAGRSLIAHELAHVVQQRSSGQPQIARQTVGAGKQPDDPAPSAEEEEGPPEWVLSILGDPEMTPQTALRALAIGAGFMGPEPKSEEEFINDLSAPNEADSPVVTEPGLSSAEAGARLTEQFTRNRAVEEAMSLMGADWNALFGSAARNKADVLGGKCSDPQSIRSKALITGLWGVISKQSKIRKIRDTAQLEFNKTKSFKAKEILTAANELLTTIERALGVPLEDLQYSPAPEVLDRAWRELGSEKTKKNLEKLGIPIPWFTTCVTVPAPAVRAAGVDTKKWGALDMFDKRMKERFKESESSGAWVPAEKKQQPQPGDLIIFVSYLKGNKGEIKKEISRATFQHVSILVAPVTKNSDGVTERWVTADGGKGSSHKGEDKSGLTVRRYNPDQQQFVPENFSNLGEAAEGGRYLLGFWSLPLLPKTAETPAKTGASK